MPRFRVETEYITHLVYEVDAEDLGHVHMQWADGGGSFGEEVEAINEEFDDEEITRVSEA